MADLRYPDGATPLDKNEMQGLIPTHITTRTELDRWEQDNINEALIWLRDKKPGDILNEKFIKLLHKKMFCNVWKWAGSFRQTEKTIGVVPYKIAIELKKLIDDAQYWIDNNTFSQEEIAVCFHHRLVWIHLFPNGNGRHARLIADIMMENVFKCDAFTWGRSNLAEPNYIRKQYIESLYAADKGNYKPLLDFARS